MKKLLFALIIFAACKSPDVKPAAQKEVRPAEVVVTGDESSIIRADEPVTEGRKEDLVKNVSKPAKQNSATTSAAPGNFTKADEIKQEQKPADSTVITDQGGGSDFEGYIPFIKQFFDR